MAEPIQGDTFWPGVDQETAAKVTKTMVPAIISAMAANAGPDPRLPGAAGYIPYTGAAEGLTGLAGLLYNLGGAAVNKIAGRQVLPPQTSLTAIGNRLAKTQDEIYEQLPHYTPTAEEAPTYETGKQFTQAVGATIPVAPASAITNLPKALSIPLSFVTPTTARPVTDMAIAAGSIPALQYALTPQQAEAAPAQQDQAPTQQGQPAQPQFSEDEENAVGAKLGNILSPFSQASQTDQSSSTSPTLSLDLGGLPGSGDVQQATAQPTDVFHEEGSSPMTWGQIGAGFAALLGGIAAARTMHGLGATMTDAARDIRLNDPAYAAKVQDYNNAQVAAQGGAISNAEGGRTPAPLPEAATQLGVNRLHMDAVAAQNQTLDSTAQARDIINLMSNNPDVATRLGNQYATTFNQTRWQSTMREFLKTGVDQSTGIRIPSPKAMFDKLDALSPQDRVTWQNGMSAANEADNRLYNYGRGVTGPDAMHDFKFTPDYDPNPANPSLFNYRQQMMSNPVLADIANDYWGIGKGMVDIGEARGFFTPQEAARMRAIRPNYVPEVGADGVITHALGPRQLGGVAGIDQVNTTPQSAMAQHLDALYKQFDLNDIVGKLTDHALDTINNNQPQMPKFLNEVPNPAGANKPSMYTTVGPSGDLGREQVYQVRRPTGSTFYRSDSPEWYNIVKGQNKNKMLSDVGIFDTARRAVQSGTTGLASLPGGRFFPLWHLARTSMTMQTNRPAGYVGSLSDLIAQKTTGGRVGQRMIYDPTQPVGIAASIGKTWIDRVAYAMGEALDPKNPTASAQLIKSITGLKNAQGLSDSLKNYYLRSTTHEFLSGGAGGSGAPLSVRPPAITVGGESPRTVRLGAAELTPRLFMPPGKMGTIKAFYVNLVKALATPYNDIMEGGNNYFYRLNKLANPDIDRASLIRETRSIVGDPGVHGASKIVQGYTGLEQYANVAMQAGARRARSVAETPLTSSASIVTQLGSVALMSVLTAMRNPQAMNYLQNIVSTQARAANAIIFGSDDPQYHTEISIPQEIRWLYPIVLEGVWKTLNIDAAIHDPASYDGAYQFLKDFFSEHVENSTVESALHGGADATSFIDVPSVVNAIGAMGGFLPGGEGFALHVNPGKILADMYHGNLGGGTFVSSIGKDNPLPNHPVGDNLFEGQDGKVLYTVMTHLFGTLGGVLDDAMGLQRNAHHLDSIWDSLGQTARDWLQKMHDANPDLNSVLWENPVRESLRPPIVELTERRMFNMKAAGGAQNAELMQDTTGGKGSLPVTPQRPDDQALPKDPAMRQLYFTVQHEHSWLQSQYIAPINQLKKQMQDASQQPMDNTQRRQWMNNQTRVITDKWRVVNQTIDDVNAKLTNLYGRRIDIGAPIDWKGDMSQFPDLN